MPKFTPDQRAAHYSARPTLKINLNAIKQNYTRLQDKVGRSVKLAASVKANAYGLGAERVGKTLYGAGCRNFFVATAGEGKQLRGAIGEAASIFVLNGPAPRDISLFNGADLKPVINSYEQAQLWVDGTREARRLPACALHIDTGMNRLGLSLQDVKKISANRKMLDRISPILIMSHLANAPDKNNPVNAQQLKRFKQAAAVFPVMPLSLVNSPGIFLGKGYHFQMVRAGLGLFAKDMTLDPADNITETAISLMAPVLQVRHIKAGETLGYDGQFKAPAPMKVAVVAAGYADGIPVTASSHNTRSGGFARIQGKKSMIIGRVSMDLTILDVTHLSKEPKLGDWAEFMGDDLLELAKASSTIPYELMTRMGNRCRRDYHTGET